MSGAGAGAQFTVCAWCGGLVICRGRTWSCEGCGRSVEPLDEDSTLRTIAQRAQAQLPGERIVGVILLLIDGELAQVDVVAGSRLPLMEGQ